MRTTMCTTMIFTRHIRTKVTFGSVGSGQPCSPRCVDRTQSRRIRIRIRPIKRVRIDWIRWIGIPILPIEQPLGARRIAPLLAKNNDEDKKRDYRPRWDSNPQSSDSKSDAVSIGPRGRAHICMFWEMICT